MQSNLINDQFRRIGQLGRGTFGIVYLCQKLKQKNPPFAVDLVRTSAFAQKGTRYYALKKFSQPSNTMDGLDYATLREIRFLSSLEHPNILKCEDMICHRKEFEFHLYMVLDFMLQLPRSLKQQPHLNQQENLRLIAYHVLLGLQYLHSKFVFHRDIKPGNVFISKNGIVKIGDFGLSREFGTPGQGFSTKVCTAEYRAPEIFFESSYYTEKADIWSYGCVVAYLYTQRDIFPAKDSNEVEMEILRNMFYLVGTPSEENWHDHKKFPKFLNFQRVEKKSIEKELGVNKDAARIIQSCLMLDPRKRPSAKDLLQDSYFEGLKDKKLDVAEFYEEELSAKLKPRPSWVEALVL